LLVALVLALPNVFGEAPALQLSRNDRTAVTQANRTRSSLSGGAEHRRSNPPTSKATARSALR
jgi:hypothetical protein